MLPAVAHGKGYEQAALKWLCGGGCQGVTEVYPAGLFVLKELTFLGATPDGIVDEQRIVEVKCPYSARYRKIKPGLIDFLQTGPQGQLWLNPGHNYYYQVHGQLQFARREICLLVVYTIADLIVIKVLSAFPVRARQLRNLPCRTWES